MGCCTQGGGGGGPRTITPLAVAAEEGWRCQGSEKSGGVSSTNTCKWPHLAHLLADMTTRPVRAVDRGKHGRERR